MTQNSDNQQDSKADKRQREAERVLRQVEMDSEALGTSSFARTANKAKNHLGGADADQQDPIEVWGTRIGRIGGAIFAIILVVWLINHFTR